jgi:hypothetical protein
VRAGIGGPAINKVGAGNGERRWRADGENVGGPGRHSEGLERRWAQRRDADGDGGGMAETGRARALEMRGSRGRRECGDNAQDTRSRGFDAL